MVTCSMLLLTLTIVINQDSIYAKNHDDEDEEDEDERGSDDERDSDFEDQDYIQVCCTWGPELADGILTYTIEGDVDDNTVDAVTEATEEWNAKLGGIKFIKTNSDDADIEINFKNDGKKIAGKTVNYFDGYGHIRKSIITISEEYYNVDFTTAQIEQVSKHELGHTLGLGHANFNGNLMTEKVNTGSGTISSCEIEAVKTANAWKLKEDGNSIRSPQEKYVRC
ncbi:MAG: matrixin family metalloprotease [Thermoproteota archaeon]|nr:matrixin family metalloprotease [Thermoproteota archaeon]